MSDNQIVPQAVTALPHPNLPLLRKVLDHIDAHPEEWDQGTFGFQRYDDPQWCGSAMCIAGWAAHLSGQRRERERTRDAGRRLLGLTESEAHALFIETIDYTKDLERQNVQLIAEAIAARAGERL